MEDLKDKFPIKDTSNSNFLETWEWHFNKQKMEEEMNDLNELKTVQLGTFTLEMFDSNKEYDIETKEGTYKKRNIKNITEGVMKVEGRGTYNSPHDDRYQFEQFIKLEDIVTITSAPPRKSWDL
jgi:hypothetical protein